MNTMTHTQTKHPEALANFIKGRILQAKRELLRAWWGSEPIYSNSLQRALPLTVSSFAELHDYCDANELGGLCDGKISGYGDILVGAKIDRDGDLNPAWIDVCNAVQGAIHTWLSDRASVDDFALITKFLSFESVDCLLDDERRADALGMLDDLESRVGFSEELCEQFRALVLDPEN